MNTAIALKAQLSWQGGIVLLLLLLPIFLSKLVRSIPRDLLFTIAGLLSALTGIVSSTQLYHSGTNQAIFTVFGLWLIGEAMLQQGVFHAFASILIPVKKGSLFRRILFFCQVVVYGAFLHHRYFPIAMLSSLLRRAEKGRGDLSAYGFPFAYLFLIGGLATAIGTPTNILFFALYSLSKGSADLFAFLPLALLPILVSFLLFLVFKRHFPKLFSQFIDAEACAIVPPDSLLIGRAQSFTAIREGKPISKTALLQSGDLVLLSKMPQRMAFSQILLFVNSAATFPKQWKKAAIILLFLGAILSTLSGIPVGTAFISAGLILFVLRPFPIKKTFQEAFPLPPLLEIFSAYVFFFAMQSSGLNAWVASLISFRSPVLLLTLFFFAAQVAAHFMPRPIAFASLFSIALAIFTIQSVQLLLLGTNIAFAAALPLFGKPLLDEIAISNAISGTTSLAFRSLLICILFATIMIPTCLLWP